jgi:NAD+ synthase
MDMALWALNQKASAKDLADMLSISESQATYVYRDIENKRRTTAYLHKSALLVG